MNKIHISGSTPADLNAVQQLLKESELPYSDIGQHFHTFLLAKHNDAIVGCVGLELKKNSGLLRSFAVRNSYQGHGIGKDLMLHLFNFCKQKSLHKLYLLTTSADNYFTNFGFVKIQRTEVPEEIQETEEFTHLCPDSAVCMTRSIL